MPRRLNTIIIVPHSKAKFLKLSFSTRTLILSASGIVLALALSMVAILYSGAAVSRSAQVERLAAENRELADVNRQLEQTVSEVQSRLDEFEQRTARLALAAGMASGSIGDRGAADESTDSAGRGGPYDRVPESPERLDLQGRWIEAQLDRVEQHLDEQARRFGSTPTIAPVMGIITDGYGRRTDPFTGRQAFHQGLDLAARRGTPVVATADGVVVYSGRDGGLGRVVKISHGFGYTTVFGHLDKVLAQPGDEVRRGDTIGLLGSTGRSTGPHLHYEVHVDGRAVNPLYYILDAF